MQKTSKTSLDTISLFIQKASKFAFFLYLLQEALYLTLSFFSQGYIRAPIYYYLDLILIPIFCLWVLFQKNPFFYPFQIIMNCLVIALFCENKRDLLYRNPDLTLNSAILIYQEFWILAIGLQLSCDCSLSLSQPHSQQKTQTQIPIPTSTPKHQTQAQINKFIDKSCFPYFLLKLLRFMIFSLQYVYFKYRVFFRVELDFFNENLYVILLFLFFWNLESLFYDKGYEESLAIEELKLLLLLLEGSTDGFGVLNSEKQFIYSTKDFRKVLYEKELGSEGKFKKLMKQFLVENKEKSFLFGLISGKKEKIDLKENSFWDLKDIRLYIDPPEINGSKEKIFTDLKQEKTGLTLDLKELKGLDSFKAVKGFGESLKEEKYNLDSIIEGKRSFPTLKKDDYEYMNKKESKSFKEGQNTLSKRFSLTESHGLINEALDSEENLLLKLKRIQNSKNKITSLLSYSKLLHNNNTSEKPEPIFLKEMLKKLLKSDLISIEAIPEEESLPEICFHQLAIDAANIEDFLIKKRLVYFFQDEPNYSKIMCLKMILFKYKDKKGMAIVLRDIENEIPHFQKENEENLQEKFINTMSHELRTPINGSLALLEEVQNRLLTDPQQSKSLLNAILCNLKIFNNTLNDIFDFSKLSLKKFHLITRELDIQALFSEIHQIISPLIKNKSLKLEIQNSPIKKLLSDPIRIRQILLNLLTNAIRFTNNGKIILFARSYCDKPLYLELGVNDSGVGMSKEKQSKLLKLDLGSEGTVGFGLTISNLLAKELNSEKKGLLIKSQEGKGSQVSFLIDLLGNETSGFNDSDSNSFSPSELEEMKEKEEFVMEKELDKKFLDFIKRKSSEKNSGFNIHSLGALGPTQKKSIQIPVILTKKTLQYSGEVDLSHSSFERRSVRERMQNTEFNYGFSSENAFSKKKFNFESTNFRESFSAKILKPKGDLLKNPCNLYPDFSEFSYIEKKNANKSSSIKERVLIADDNEFNLMALKLQLEKHGLLVDEARNGEEVVQKVLISLQKGEKQGSYKEDNMDIENIINFNQKSKFAINRNLFDNINQEKGYKLIFMDLDMPVKNGFEASEELMVIFANYDVNIPVIACTAFQDEVKEHCFRSGMSGFLKKPITGKDLTTVLSIYE